MLDVKREIVEKINRLQSDLDYYEEKVEDIKYKDNWYIIENKIHDLRIEMNTYYDILDFLESRVN